jgi:hypothetical protein
MKEYTVHIPQEKYRGILFKQEGKKGNALINISLIEFEPKLVFRWHFSIMIELDNCDEDGFPTILEIEKIDQMKERIDANLISRDISKPNGLFLAKIFWNRTCELIWRIYEPEILDKFLKDIIADKTYSNDFDYRIDDDIDWDLAKWHLEKAK